MALVGNEPEEKIRPWLTSRAFVVYTSAALVGAVLAVAMLIVLRVAGDVTVAEPA